MLFLSEEEKTGWRTRGERILQENIPVDEACQGIRPNLVPVYQFFVGALLAAKGQGERGCAWIRAGAMQEQEGVFFNTFLASYLDRHEDRLVMPSVIFQDPAPFLHFASTPVLCDARAKFRDHCARSLPVFMKPFRIMDAGCGDGGLLVSLLSHLREKGRIGDIAEILLVDASAAMCAMAREKVQGAFPGVSVHTVQSRIENFSGSMEGHFDVVLSSLAYHHMPREAKLLHLRKMTPHMDHFIIFELDANNDNPEQFSPELALSVYQLYGRLIDMVFAHDAPLETAIPSVDAFLMAEAVTFLICPRGERTDYHMRNIQWHELFREAFDPSLTCHCDSIAYSDEHCSFFTLHYGR